MKKIRMTAVGLLSAALLAGFGSPATADPDDVSRARSELERIHQEASAIDQEIIEASERATQSAVRLKQVRSDLGGQERKVEQIASDLGEIAMAQFQTRGMDVTAQLLTSASDEDFLASLGTIQNETDRSNADLQNFQVEQARLDELKQDAAATDAALQADKQAKITLAKDFDAKEAQADAVYQRLDAQEKERLRQLEQERQRKQEEADRKERQEAERRALEEAASRDAGQTTSARAQQPATTPAAATEPGSRAAATPPAAATDGGAGADRAQRAVDIALAQVGSAYVWGTSGPSTFDCSGLTSYAYRQVGIDITRSSRGQLSVGRSVSKGELKPGDLVFYYSPVSHVGIYIGNGRIVDAANPRNGVRVTSLNSMPYSGARRLVG